MEIENAINNEIKEFESPNSERDLKNIAKTLIRKYHNAINRECNVPAFLIELFYCEFRGFQSKIKKYYNGYLDFRSTVDLTGYNLKEADFERIADIINGYLHKKRELKK